MLGTRLDRFWRVFSPYERAQMRSVWIFDAKIVIQLSIRLTSSRTTRVRARAREVLHFFRICLLTLLLSTWITARYRRARSAQHCLLYTLATVWKWSRVYPANKVVFSANVSVKIIAWARSYWPSLIFPTQNEVFTSPPAHWRYFVFFSFLPFFSFCQLDARQVCATSAHTATAVFKSFSGNLWLPKCVIFARRQLILIIIILMKINY